MILRVAAFLMTCLGALQAGDWPQWRGPQQNGISSEKVDPSLWPESGPKRLWRARVGQGFSSMVMGDGRVFTLGLEGNEEVLTALNASDGKVLWTHRRRSTFEPQFYEGGTSGTPTLAGDVVYLLSQTGKLGAFRASDGSVLWETRVDRDTGAEIGMWGFTGAPLVHEDLLILNVGTHGTAVNRTTGKVAWTSGPGKNGYATPVPYSTPKGTRVAVFAADTLTSLDPESGMPDWSLPWKTQYDVNAADPVFMGTSVLISSGYGTGAALYDLSGGKPREVWRNKNLRTQFNPAIAHQGHVYGIDGDTTGAASLVCVDVASGRRQWSEPGIGSGGLVLAGETLLVLTAQGELLAAPVSEKGFRPVRRAQVLGGKCWNTPVLANGVLYVRNSKGDLAALEVGAR